MTSLYVYYALCFVHFEHSVCHEPISVLIFLYIYIYIYNGVISENNKSLACVSYYNEIVLKYCPVIVKL